MESVCYSTTDEGEAGPILTLSIESRIPIAVVENDRIGSLRARRRQ